MSKRLAVLIAVLTVAACGDDVNLTGTADAAGDATSDSASDGGVNDTDGGGGDATSDAAGDLNGEDAGPLPDGLPDPAPPYGPPPGTPEGTPTGIYYDIVYVRGPRFGDDTDTEWPEVFDPINVEPGTDLMLLHPDGSEEVLVAGGDGAVVDPYVTFDGRSVLYAYFPDVRPESLNTQRRDAPRAGADIFRIDLQSREITQLTFQEFTPNSGAGNWAEDPNSSAAGLNAPRHGVFNLGPCPLAGDRIMFTSSRTNYLPNASFTYPNLQLFVMDADGRNVELVGHLSLGSSLHPTPLADGRVMFSSYEAQGLRDRRLWGLWAIWPDGRVWEPLMSAFAAPNAFHFQTQLSDGYVVLEEYYNLNNNGFGTFIQFPAWRPDGAPPFGSATAGDASNPPVRTGWNYRGDLDQYFETNARYPFSPWGVTGLTEFAHGNDNASSQHPDTGDWSGKVTHPAAAPHNDLLLVYSPGPANDLNRPTNRPAVDGGLYRLVGAQPTDDPADLELILDSPSYNEMQPRPVVPYEDIYGLTEPFELTFLPNEGDRHRELPAGTPFGLVGTSSFYKRDSTPGSGSAAFDGLDPFNTSENGASTNWFSQGADAGRYDNADIYAVRILSLEPNSYRSYGPGSGTSWRNHANERMRILGEIPLLKPDGEGDLVMDVDGNPDTSFLARIPADVPFTFQTLDRNGMVLNMAQTWHQVRPGETRNDCGGCHAHSQVGTPFEVTFAARPEYDIADLTERTPLLTVGEDAEPGVREVDAGAVDVEYYRDIRPLLQRSCVSCHGGDAPAAELNLDDDALIDGFEGTWHRLANDQDAQWGLPPVISNGSWRQSNASRYIRMFQSRRSLLVWKLYGRRLDGWSNADHPTESVPGDAGTLPVGASPNDADLDYTGEIMPPPDADEPPLTDDERLLFVRWIDLGCPISSQNDELAPYGWFLDDLRPTLTVTSPRAGRVRGPIDELRIGAFDYYSGLVTDSLQVTADVAINGEPAGSQLAPLFEPEEDFVWRLGLDPPIEAGAEGTLTVRIRDVQGNWTEILRSFSVR